MATRKKKPGPKPVVKAPRTPIFLSVLSPVRERWDARKTLRRMGGPELLVSLLDATEGKS